MKRRILVQWQETATYERPFELDLGDDVDVENLDVEDVHEALDEQNAWDDVDWHSVKSVDEREVRHAVHLADVAEPKALNPQAPLTEDDLCRCPNCGSEGAYWLQEIAERGTWQPLTLALDDGKLTEGDYDSFDYGDDVDVESFECRTCQCSWDTLAELQRALQAAANARADAERIENARGSGFFPWLEDEHGRALASFVTDTRLRALLEQHDQQALAQARKAIGLAHDTKEATNG